MSSIDAAVDPVEFVQSAPDLDAPFSSIVTPSTTTLPVKAQVLPFVYIQTPSKLPFTSITKTNNNSMLVNTVPQLQFATLPPCNNQSRTLSTNQGGVILAPVKGKAQQLIIRKPANVQTLPVVPVSAANKITGTYLTMIKPLTQLGDKPDTLQVPSSSTVIQAAGAGKYVIAPMSKVIKNRLPVTVTTNTLQPKIAFMPLTIPTTNQDGTGPKMFNIKITDGQLQGDYSSHRDNLMVGADENPDLTCDEVIDLHSPVKSEKEYELSIVEDSDSKGDANFGAPPDLEIRRKEAPKFAHHGISILKKNYQNDKLRTICLNANQNQINNNPSLIIDLDAEIETKAKAQQKPERRRKSNFAYRRDYDDMEIETADPSAKAQHSEPADDQPDINMNDEFDLKKVLKWNEGIGSLPGSNLKFIMNEFNLLEYVTKDEYDRIMEKRAKPNKVKNELQEDLRCAECGCYGLPSEFVTPQYCSLDCRESGASKLAKEKEKALKQRKRKRGWQTKKSSETCDQSSSDEKNTSNENSQDKFSYPWTCTKKGFSWTKYLDHVKAKAAPVKLFKDPFPYNRNGFRPGMKLEGIDPHHPSYFCVLSVSETCGYRVRLHFDGYPENYDFWVNADSMDIFPAGWCEKHSHVLQPPSGHTLDNFSWVTYLKQTKSSAAPKHLFANRAGNTICPNGFRVGMKLEAVDRKNTALVCVATVKDMMDNRILVHFDSWDDIYDYWVDPTSPYIHPVGWCDQYGHNLTPPNDYPNKETFTWNKYLKETKAVPAPVRAFKQRPACGFKRGMRLECVDKRVPQLIRAATVDEVRDHRLRILFDGWPDRYSYWMDDDSEDLHPVGWCQKTGHPIETPLTPDDVYDFLECPTVGCRGMGHTEGAKYSTHSEQKYCPYAENNIDAERILPDRLLTPDRHIESVVPLSIEPKDKVKPKMGRPPKHQRPEPIKSEPDREPGEKKPKRKPRKRLKLDPEALSKARAAILIEESKMAPAEKESWAQHSMFLHSYTRGQEHSMGWSAGRVADFVATMPWCRGDAEKFRRMDIDGEAFLMLRQKDLTDILRIKVGPAVKLYNLIVLLRTKFFREMFS